MDTQSTPATISSAPLSAYDPAIEERTQRWFSEGRRLVWIPIISRRNFPRMPLHLLEGLDSIQDQIRFPIRGAEELFQLPENVTGWLMPADSDDTDIVCVARKGEVHFMTVRDGRTGRKQSLRGDVDEQESS